MPPSSSNTDLAVVLLTQKGDVKQGKLRQSAGIQGIATSLKKKDAPSTLGHYTYKGKVLWLFGHVEGKAGTENQHHLPPPLEGLTFFGDILVLCSNQATDLTKAIKDASSFKTADYEQFYTQVLEGDDGDSENDSELLEDDLPEGDLGAEDQGEAEDSEENYDDSDHGSDEEGNLNGEDDEGEGEEEPEPLPKKQKLTRTKKQILPPAALEEPELEEDAVAEGCAHRQKILSILHSTFHTWLSTPLQQELEMLLYRRALAVANKQEIRASWQQTTFRDVYYAEARRIIGNLNPKSYVGNTSLMTHFLNGELTLEQIVNQNYYELFPEHWKTLVDHQAKKEKIQLEGDFSRATDRWQCNNCKQRKCTYYELQTRSADEPMTIFIHCLNCGKRWTQ
jgi:DNA-directed RNA polymerase subunit M/transcription elongation factor TFIIS